jgi:signal transduction histidine kinase
MRFTPDGGRITLQSTLSDTKARTLCLIVADTGIGIAPENLERIFDDFFQVRSGMKDKTRGTGLGLSLVKRIVRMHGGRVWAESPGISKGSRFVIELPLTD